MKKTRSHSSNRARKMACTVSAAALMLGVSQAATVGLNFQVNYCADPRYAGFNVTATAFGIGTNQWESLTPMDTGYGCGATIATLNQLINTSTLGGGLHPLPNGSLNVSWSANMANFSGFAGYVGGKATAGYDGPPPVPIPTGEWQIYSGFLRDGVNFGPGSSNGDNNQQNYNVDIVGLKSVFTNTPFVIQLVAASDSMQKLTNAFIIDATLSSTQSVTYPSTPFPFHDEGSTGGWLRGHGGGLSTVSGTLNTDHVMITGNRAAHGTAGGSNGFDNASTISAFIVTDKPVVTMSPQPVSACGGDTITLNPYAIGVAPLHYEWRKDGAALAGANASSYVIPSATAANGGNYDLVVTNLYGSTTSKVATVTVDRLTISPKPSFTLDSKPRGTPANGLDFGATWLASNADSAGTNRTGVMKFTAANPDQITIPGTTNFDSSSGTIMFWMRSAGTTTNGGIGAALLDRRTDNGTNSGSGIIMVQQDDGTIYTSVALSANDMVSTTPISDNKWHHIALVFDQNNANSIYIDGVLDASAGNLAPWPWPVGQEIELGRSHDSAWEAYNGLMDDFRFYDRILTDPEIASIHANGALVDTTALQVRLNFDSTPVHGITITWQCPDGVLQSATNVAGPYTDVPAATSPYSVPSQSTTKFYRYRHTSQVIVSNPYLM
jgi:hypothetical protein